MNERSLALSFEPVFDLDPLAASDTSRAPSLEVFSEQSAIGHESLADLIARHFQSAAEYSADASSDPALFTQPDSTGIEGSSASGLLRLAPIDGRYLFDRLYRSNLRRVNLHHQPVQPIHIDQLDVEAANGLEHLLPSTATRARVIKYRLDQEIEALNQRLSEYQSILDAAVPNTQTPFKHALHSAGTSGSGASVSDYSEIRRQVQGIQARLQVLIRHRQHAELALELLKHQPSPGEQWEQLKAKSASAGKRIGAFIAGSLKGLTQSPERRQLDEAFDKLTRIQHLLQQEMDQPHASPETIGALFLEYERAMKAVQQSPLQL